MSGDELAALSRAHELFAEAAPGKWRWTPDWPRTTDSWHAPRR